MKLHFRHLALLVALTCSPEIAVAGCGEAINAAKKNLLRGYAALFVSYPNQKLMRYAAAHRKTLDLEPASLARFYYVIRSKYPRQGALLIKTYEEVPNSSDSIDSENMRLQRDALQTTCDPKDYQGDVDQTIPVKDYQFYHAGVGDYRPFPRKFHFHYISNRAKNCVRTDDNNLENRRQFLLFDKQIARANVASLQYGERARAQTGYAAGELPGYTQAILY